jgi:hypothetical protein
MNDFMTKPIDKELFESVLDYWTSAEVLPSGQPTGG